MKLSERWLREWVNPAISNKDLAEQLTMAGLEVEGVEPAAAVFSNVVVGLVLDVTRHPEADRLNVCTVDINQSEKLTIVCGAKNVKPGIKVPAALIGAELPGGLKIKKAKLRGVESSGMLCSATEIGIAESADGLLILPDDAPVGKDIREYLTLDDSIIEIDFTPNRGDCLSIKGLTREIAVLNDLPCTVEPIEKVKPSCDDKFPIQVQAPNACPVYLARVIKGIDNRAATPVWMAERLRRAGLRSLGPVVDVTNYVLLELGQPLHAFDLAKLEGAIVVRHAHPDEALKLLDGSEHKLASDVLVIADERKALAFAGVMGGDDSAVSDETTSILLECAYFSPDAIRGKGRRYGLQTDSSYRFERGVDFSLQQEAIERATALILAIAGGQCGPVIEQKSAKDLPKRPPITLRMARIGKILGVDIKESQIKHMLGKLGMILESGNNEWQVTPPSYRFDIAIEADLIEEVGRIYGYNQIPVRVPKGELKLSPQAEGKVVPRRIRQVLVDRGYQEAITYSFVDPDIQRLVDPDTRAIALENPISADMSVMRTSLWCSLLKSVSYNLARQQPRVRLFEIGKRFRQLDGGLHQQTMIAGVITGDLFPAQWDSVNKVTDFFDIKSDVEAILGLTSCSKDFIFKGAKHPALHPGQSAMIERMGKQVGWVGLLHPSLQKQLDLPSRVFMFELAYEEVMQGRVPKFAPISKFPSIRRDLALVMDEKVPADDVMTQVLSIGKTRLKSVELFDVYRGKGVAEGKKSLAIALIIQDDKQTLTDSEVDAIISDILVSLRTTVGATLRE